MGKPSRDKGLRIERELVQLHRDMGIYAERVPLSGASKYRENGADIDIYPGSREDAPLVAEIKARKGGAGFTLLERWLADYDLLFLRRNNADPMVVLPWRIWRQLLTGDDGKCQRRINANGQGRGGRTEPSVAPQQDFTSLRT